MTVGAPSRSKDVRLLERGLARNAQMREIKIMFDDSDSAITLEDTIIIEKPETGQSSAPESSGNMETVYDSVTIAEGTSAGKKHRSYSGGTGWKHLER